MKVIFIPGNGGGGPNDNWFPYLKTELEKMGVQVVASEFPDNIMARESYWIPFLKDELKADDQSILVGHSSGAIAAMRLAEQQRLLGTVLVGAYHTDLGMPMEIKRAISQDPGIGKRLNITSNGLCSLLQSMTPGSLLKRPALSINSFRQSTMNL